MEVTVGPAYNEYPIPCYNEQILAFFSDTLGHFEQIFVHQIAAGTSVVNPKTMIESYK